METLQYYLYLPADTLLEKRQLSPVVIQKLVLETQVEFEFEPELDLLVQALIQLESLKLLKKLDQLLLDTPESLSAPVNEPHVSCLRLQVVVLCCFASFANHALVGLRSFQKPRARALAWKL